VTAQVTAMKVRRIRISVSLITTGETRMVTQQ
jgi:hypothetical protein